MLENLDAPRCQAFKLIATLLMIPWGKHLLVVNTAKQIWAKKLDLLCFGCVLQHYQEMI